MIESCFTSILFWQIFTAQINQVFPAEDDVNKHVEDNCEFVLPKVFSLHKVFVSHHLIKLP